MFFLKNLLIYLVFILLNFVVFFFEIYKLFPIEVCVIIVLDIMAHLYFFRKEGTKRISFAFLISVFLKLLFCGALCFWFYLGGQDEVSMLVMCLSFFVFYIFPTVIMFFVYFVLMLTTKNKPTEKEINKDALLEYLNEESP